MGKGNKSGSGRIALIVQYDGTHFNGWQIQENGRTVQQELENAIRILTGEYCRVAASGRTDTGVHALGQVAHFDLCRDIALPRLCIGLNGILGSEISIKNAYSVNDDFHSRHSAVEREYKYYIYNYSLRTPFMKYRAMWVNRQIDENYMTEAISFLIGEHDFASFCKKKSSDVNTIREIKDIKIRKFNNIYEIRIRGNAFLHNMIRIIVGTIVQMHIDGDSPEKIKVILEKNDRDFSGPTAPPYGLYLNKIFFEPELATYESAF